jgi:DNA gyrase/topoisomerase IV subunit A
MSDQFKRQKITQEIARIKKLAEQAQKELAEIRREFNYTYALIVQERVSLKKRAEKAEAESARLRELITEHDGIECAKHDVLVRAAIKEETRLRTALAFYGNPENWRFTHDRDGNLLWVTSIGPDYALEILGEKKEVKP